MWKFSYGCNFHVFGDISFFVKITPAKKLNPYDFIKKKGVLLASSFKSKNPMSLSNIQAAHTQVKRWTAWCCEIIYFRGAQFSWIHENGYIRGDVISWVGGFEF